MLDHTTATHQTTDDLGACVVIPLFRADRDRLYLGREATRWAVDDLSEKLGVVMSERHRSLFASRRYRCVDDIRKALTRFKVFGDLGYGGV
jgi:hypothetical protein